MMINTARLGRVLLIALVAGSLNLVSTHRSDAQVLVGGGIKFSTADAFDLGLQAGGYFPIAALPGLRIGGDVSYYFPKTQNVLGVAEVETDLLAFNINGQYVLPLQPALWVYGLAGLSIGRASVSADAPGFGQASETETDTGLNIGGGAEFAVGFGRIYAEAKFVTGDFDRFGIAGGIRIPF
jgi:opacity protein-like surface antigen